MDLVRRILRGAPAKMSTDAVVVLEIGHERTNFERAYPRAEVAWPHIGAGDNQVLLMICEALQRL